MRLDALIWHTQKHDWDWREIDDEIRTSTDRKQIQTRSGDTNTIEIQHTKENTKGTHKELQKKYKMNTQEIQKECKKIKTRD